MAPSIEWLKSGPNRGKGLLPPSVRGVSLLKSFKLVLMSKLGVQKRLEPKIPPVGQAKSVRRCPQSKLCEATYQVVYNVYRSSCHF